VKQRYDRIEQLSHQHSVQVLCRVLVVARSGYYAWKRQGPNRWAREDAQLSQLLVKAHGESRQTYGRPRLQEALRRQGYRCGGKRIGRLMKAAGLFGRKPKRFRPRTTESNHAGPIARNLLAERSRPQAPNQVWVTDITYINTSEGWLYMSAMLDLYSRRVVGWAFASHLQTELPLAALQMALEHRVPTKDLLHHSDRGCQYASADYRDQLAGHGLEPSMSRAGNCYDNAAMESFWSTLKLELVYRQTFLSRAQAQTAIFDYIETFYNRKRFHSALGYKSPVDFETNNN
jgi:putative transposase